MNKTTYLNALFGFTLIQIATLYFLPISFLYLKILSFSSVVATLFTRYLFIDIFKRRCNTFFKYFLSIIWILSCFQVVTSHFDIILCENCPLMPFFLLGILSSLSNILTDIFILYIDQRPMGRIFWLYFFSMSLVFIPLSFLNYTLVVDKYGSNTELANINHNTNCRVKNNSHNLLAVLKDVEK